MPNTIAILATGDELIHGDILNTSTPWLANQLVERGFNLSTHMSVTDQQSEIVNALTYLLNFNNIVITTGGLGPTSDDRTRYAIAQVANKALVFDETSWLSISERLNGFNIPVTENNKQQAIFPEQAMILPNKNGTANGCIVKFNDKVIIMLPGPPFECRELFNEYVLTYLLTQNIHQPRFVKKWRVFNVSESDIASKLDPIFENTNAVIGYRVDYPYLEIKLYCGSESELSQFQPKVAMIICEHYLADEYLKASDKLAQYLTEHPVPMLITDRATKGYWQYQLLNLTSLPQLAFHPSDATIPTEYTVTITGLDEFWQADNTAKSSQISIEILHHQERLTKQYTLPLRGKRTLVFATELVSACLLNVLSSK